MVARCRTRSGLCTECSTEVSWRRAGPTAAPAARNAPRIAVARCGTSVPASRTPSQTSPAGSCRRQSASHTTGICSRPVRGATGSVDITGFLLVHALGVPQPDEHTTRARDLGIRIGVLPAGPTASIADVPGLGVGHVTVWRDEPPPPAGRGVARTGVTVVDPGGSMFAAPVPAGGAVLNGAGECTGFLSMSEWGLAETPVFLTSTMQVGRVYDAACQLLADDEPGIGVEEVIIPLVAECDDSFLSDPRRMQVSAADVRTAREAARAAGLADTREPPAEGAVGAGTGMSCLGFKGGIGTSSRRVPSGHTVGVLTLTNFGDQDRLTVDGVPVGRMLPSDSNGRGNRPPAGSCITVVVTDGPLDA